MKTKEEEICITILVNGIAQVARANEPGVFGQRAEVEKLQCSSCGFWLLASYS